MMLVVESTDRWRAPVQTIPPEVLADKPIYQPVLLRMSELSAQYPRYGYRRIAIFLRRDGCAMSFSRAHRLWHEARL